MLSPDALRRLPASLARDPDLAYYVAWALSLYMVRARKSPGNAAALCRGLAHCGRVALPEEQSAPNPEIALGGYKGTGTVLKNWRAPLDLVRDKQLVTDFRHVALLRHPRLLPGELLLDLFPGPIWEVVALLLTEGPAPAQTRAAFALEDFASVEVKANRRRPRGPRSRRYVEIHQNALRRLFNDFEYMHTGSPLHTLLAKWRTAPKVPMPNVELGVGYKVTAPDLVEVRRLFTQTTGDIQGRLKIGPQDDEVAAMKGMSDHALRDAGLFWPLRRRVVIILLPGKGCRADAASRVNRNDLKESFDPVDRVFAGRAALIIRPEKHDDQWVERPKVLTDEELACIKAYTYYVDRMMYDSYNGGRGREKRAVAPFIAPDGPLLVTDMVNGERMSPVAIARMCSGTLPRGVPGTPDYEPGQKPLIRRTRGVNPELPEHVREYLGWTAPEYRHLAYQLAMRSGENWNSKHPRAAGEVTPEPTLYATALCDQKPEGERLRAIYGDRSDADAYERFAARAGDGNWRLITGEDGARKTVDIDRYRGVVDDLRRVRASLERDEAHLDRLVAPRLHLADAPVQNLNRGKVTLKLIAAQNQLLLEQQRELAETLRHVDDRLREVERVNASIRRRREEVTDLEAERSRLRFDQSTWRVVEDDEALEVVDLDVLDASVARPDVSVVSEPSLVAVRDWAIGAEILRLKRMSDRASLHHWVNLRHLPRRAEEHPWPAPGPAPVDASEGSLYLRFWVPGMLDGFWTTDLMRRELEEMLSAWPQHHHWVDKNGRPRKRCHNDLSGLPEPYRSRWLTEGMGAPDRPRLTVVRLPPAAA